MSEMSFSRKRLIILNPVKLDPVNSLKISIREHINHELFMQVTERSEVACES